jgi:restriction endonuclease Mrr
LMLALAAMESFPNLERQPDAVDLLANARAAVAELRAMTEQYSALAEERERLEQERLAETARLEARRSHDRVLDELKTRFVAMYSETNAQRRGREFEGLLNELFALYDLNPRKSFVLENEQIDGAFTFNTDDYLLEAKWEKDPASRGSVDQLAMKIKRKGKNTLGLFLAVSGFSGPAVEAHSDCGSALVFMDGADLFAVLDGTIRLTELLDAKRRHLSETGIPLLLVKDILGR